MKVIVIGGVAASMSAASKIKRINKETQVVVYEKGGFLSYGACGLPYYVGNFNDDYRKMIARTRDQFEQAGIETYLYHEVVQVNPYSKTVRVRNLETNHEFEENYDKLMVGTGAAAILPPFEGLDLLGVHTLKTMEDGIFLREYAQDPAITDVTIVGGGYIGIECAEAFLSLNKKVRVIEAAPRILASFDEEIADIGKKELEKHGVEVLVGEKVQKFVGENAVTAVQTDKGTYQTQLVIVAVGVRPSTGFLKDTGIELAGNGAIIVDRSMRTSLPDVYAAGDCAVTYNRVSGENGFLALGTVANKCGRIAGTNIMGGNEEFVGALGSAAIKICDLEAFRTGLGELEAKRLGKNYKTVQVTTFDHPGYYPGQTPIAIKLIYEQGSKIILGAQLCGQKGAVLRGDIFAVAVHQRMTTNELGMLDLAYAPPFAGVWDAVHIACNAAK